MAVTSLQCVQMTLQVEVHICVEQLCSYCVKSICSTHLTFLGMFALTPH